MNLRKKTPFNTEFKSMLMLSTKLPTFIDVLSHYMYLNDTNNNKKEVIYETVLKIEDIWKSASLPTIASRSIFSKLSSYLSIVRTMRKSEKSRYFKLTATKHKEKYTILFDICSCKCSHETRCNCIRNNIVPVAERYFLEDQRTVRLMSIDICSMTATTMRSRIRSTDVCEQGPSKRSRTDDAMQGEESELVIYRKYY